MYRSITVIVCFMDLEVLTVDQAAESIPGGIYFGLERTIEVCNNNCVDRQVISEELRRRDTSVTQKRCLGACATYGKCETGAYAIMPVINNIVVIKSKKPTQ